MADASGKMRLRERRYVDSPSIIPESGEITLESATVTLKRAGVVAGEVEDVDADEFTTEASDSPFASWLFAPELLGLAEGVYMVEFTLIDSDGQRYGPNVKVVVTP